VIRSSLASSEIRTGARPAALAVGAAAAASASAGQASAATPISVAPDRIAAASR
jgi:hypothetical protein